MYMCHKKQQIARRDYRLHYFNFLEIDPQISYFRPIDVECTIELVELRY